MKLLFIIAEYFPDGAGSGRSVRTLAEALAEKGHAISVLRLSDDNRRREETLNGVKIYHVPIRNIYGLSRKNPGRFMRLLWHSIDSWNIRAAYDVKAVIAREAPDIVNTNVIAGFSPAIFAVIKRAGKERGIKLVHTLRDYYLLCPKSSMFKGGQNCEKICAGCKPFAWLRARQAANVDLFLANSAFVLQRHQRHGAIAQTQKAAVQYNANIDNKISPPRKPLKNNPVRIGFIGRVAPVKGIEILLQAAANLQFNGPTLKIAGTGDEAYIDHLKLTYPDPRIKFLGFQDPENFYQEIDILVCPSLYEEPLARVIYEAYRAALPVIAAKTGGTPEIITHGKTGFLYDSHDIKALAAHIDTLAQDGDLYHAMSTNAARKAQDFTRTKICDEFLAHIAALNPRKAA